MAKATLVGAAYKLAQIWTALQNAVRNVASQLGISEADADAAIDRLEAKESASLLARLASLILGKEAPVQVTWPCQVLAPELIPQGYTVLGDVAPQEFQVADLEFVGFLEGKEDGVSGRVMRGRAVIKEANLGLADGKRILAEQQNLPADLRGCYIVLTGTLLRDAGGDLCVACLHWNGARWILHFNYLCNDFGSCGRLPRRK